MSPRCAPIWLRLFPLAIATSGCAVFSGCLAVTLTGKAVTTTVGVAADVASATVRGTGKVAAAVIGAGGDVAGESVKAAATLSKTGMVVFFDPKTGTIWETPWAEGLKLAAAAETAKVDGALKAVRVIRAGKAISATSEEAKMAVKSGDVIELAGG